MKIKEKPEDFQVDEVTSVEAKDFGRFAYYKLWKKNYNTMDAVIQIAKILHIPVKKIGFAGTKDRIAVTTQYISFDQVKRERIDALEMKDIKLEFYGYGDSPISLGDLKGNSFVILVKEIDEPKKVDRFVNYFGPQRFSRNNVEIGLSMIKKDFKSAVELVDHYVVQEYIKKKPNDFVGAIRNMPRKILLLFIHSYQSKIWNETVKQLLDKGIEVDEVPIVGFGTELDGEIGSIIESIMSADGINQRDFIIRSIPELTSEGGMRTMHAEVKEMKIEKENDDYRLSFFLPKGSYATTLLDQLS